MKFSVLDQFSEFFRGVRFLGRVPRFLTLPNFKGGQVPGYPTLGPPTFLVLLKIRFQMQTDLLSYIYFMLLAQTCNKIDFHSFPVFLRV